MMKKPTISAYKDALCVRLDERMLIYGLTQKEADDFCRMCDLRMPGDLSTPAAFGDRQSARPASRPSTASSFNPSQSSHRGKGRPLVLEAYAPIITNYMETTSNPTIRELDNILSLKGAAYASTVSIKNMLQKLGHPIPPTSRRFI